MKTPEQRKLEWSGEGSSRSVRIEVKSWHYRVEVERLGRASRSLKFEEPVSIRGLGGIEVSGEIGTDWLREPLPPRVSKDAFDAAKLGTLRLIESESESPAFLALDVSLPPESWAALPSPFLHGQSSLSLGLRVTHAQANSPGFWKAAWRTEQLDITDVTVSASRAPSIQEVASSFTKQLVAVVLGLVAWPVIALLLLRACS